MKNTKRIRRSKVEPIDINDFEQLATACETVEHLTVPGFLRRIPHPWHIDDMTRYGDKVGRVAEAMQLSYLTTIQPRLGMIRVFPLPLLQRVYELMAPQFQWPVEPALLEEGRERELRRTEGTKKHLEGVAGQAPNPAVAEAFVTVIDYLENETNRLRGMEPNLRPV